jgi:hypothetical protein
MVVTERDTGLSAVTRLCGVANSLYRRPESRSKH